MDVMSKITMTAAPNEQPIGNLNARYGCLPIRPVRPHGGQALSLAASLGQIYQIRHDRAACSRWTGWILLRTIGGALIQPVCQSGAFRAEYLTWKGTERGSTG